MISDQASLKARHRAERDTFPQPLSLRVHRALSWLQRAEQEKKDGDACFIFLWIAFNAAYARELEDRQDSTERRLFRSFLKRLITVDEGRQLYDLVWQQFPGPIRLLLENEYVFQPFWDFHNGRLQEAEWRAAFERSKRKARRALGKVNTLGVLDELFDRLYVLRNQLLHGGATWNSAVNRAQIAQGSEILGRIVPTVISLLMDHPQKDWGAVSFPVVEA